MCRNEIYKFIKSLSRVKSCHTKSCHKSCHKKVYRTQKLSQVVTKVVTKLSQKLPKVGVIKVVTKVGVIKVVPKVDVIKVAKSRCYKKLLFTFNKRKLTS